jgi:anti-sigma28 factor (negative regulator of flagellin synthesis)
MMRIDPLNRTSIANSSEKSGPAAQQTEALARSDQADISHLAKALATPAADRIEQLRLQVQSGVYDVSAEAIAGALIDAHIRE